MVEAVIDTQAASHALHFYEKSQVYQQLVVEIVAHDQDEASDNESD